MRFTNAATILKAFARAAGPVDINEVGPETVQTFLKGSRRISSTWHLKHYTLAGLFRFAMQRGLVSTSPVPYLIPKRPDYATPYIYSTDELRRLLDAMEALDRRHPKTGRAASVSALTFRTLILLLYGAGLRLSEALALTVDDVDLSANLLVVRLTKFFVEDPDAADWAKALVGAGSVCRKAPGTPRSAAIRERLLAPSTWDRHLPLRGGALLQDSPQPCRHRAP